jgi:hypothetical protein
VLLAVGASAIVDPVAAQETVLSARLTADLTAADGSAEVRVEYRVRGAARGSTIPASVLDFGPAAAEDVRVGGTDVPLVVRAGAGVSRETDVPVEATDREDVGRVVVRYRVPSVVDADGGVLRGRIPVLTLDRPPDEAGPGLFLARLSLPAHWQVIEGFPTGLESVSEAGVHEVRLSVVPAMVGFRARTGGAWRPDLPLVLDAVAAAVVALFVLAGWRHLRREAA